LSIRWARPSTASLLDCTILVKLKCRQTQEAPEAFGR
jgi:hypothetical protein